MSRRAMSCVRRTSVLPVSGSRSTWLQTTHESMTSAMRSMAATGARIAGDRVLQWLAPQPHPVVRGDLEETVLRTWAPTISALSAGSRVEPDCGRSAQGHGDHVMGAEEANADTSGENREAEIRCRATKVRREAGLRDWYRQVGARTQRSPTSRHLAGHPPLQFVQTIEDRLESPFGMDV